MIVGIGIDIVEIERVKDIVDRQKKFVDRILTVKEQEYYFQLQGNRQVEYLSGRFAAKEAYAKAVGTGIGESLRFIDIEVLRGPSGKPFFNEPKRKEKVHLSITHSKNYAVSQVIIESLSS